MPLQKVAKKREPLWKEWDKLAQKEGSRKTFYAVGGDEYTGDWHDNKKHGMQMKRSISAFFSPCASYDNLLLYIAGKGVQIWKHSGLRYEGDWAYGNRHGFGMLSLIVREGGGEELVKKYAGGWKNDLRHVRSMHTAIQTMTTTIT